VLALLRVILNNKGLAGFQGIQPYSRVILRGHVLRERIIRIKQHTGVAVTDKSTHCGRGVVPIRQSGHGLRGGQKDGAKFPRLRDEIGIGKTAGPQFREILKLIQTGEAVPAFRHAQTDDIHGLVILLQDHPGEGSPHWPRIRAEAQQHDVVLIQQSAHVQSGRASRRKATRDARRLQKARERGAGSRHIVGHLFQVIFRLILLSRIVVEDMVFVTLDPLREHALFLIILVKNRVLEKPEQTVAQRIVSDHGGNHAQCRLKGGVRHGEIAQQLHTVARLVHPLHVEILIAR